MPTSADKNGVSNRVDNGLDGRHTRNPAVEVVVRAKVPPRQPQRQVVAHPKEPDDGEVSKGHDARPIRDVPQPLGRLVREAGFRQGQL